MAEAGNFDKQPIVRVDSMSTVSDKSDDYTLMQRPEVIYDEKGVRYFKPKKIGLSASCLSDTDIHFFDGEPKEEPSNVS